MRKLGGLLQPPLKGRPGALDCGAPEFLDYLIGVSPADRQQLYKAGLDSLNAQAKKQYGKTFADLEASQADAILKPLLVVIAWDEDLPKDPVKHFVAQAHRDFRTATVNSRDYAASAASSGRARRARYRHALAAHRSGERIIPWPQKNTTSSLSAPAIPAAWPPTS